jgi:hypothetical protein
MTFNPSISGLLSMGHGLCRVLLAFSLSVRFAAAAGAETRPVVLELFTSEGCSSCPPTEVIVNELAQRPNVLPLSFHVDYWDVLGSRDRCSLASATERQRVYARTLRRSLVYTPQTVIDGSRGIVGYLREATTPIGRGENSGRTLKESNIVLWLYELGRWNEKPREFEMNMSRLPENVTDIAELVQSASQGAILGAVAQSVR